MTELAKSTAREARERAGRIRVGMVQYLHTLADVAAAYAARDWLALGYGSWDEYIDGEYGADRLKLSPEHRQKAVAELRLSGMSQRAIGSVLSVGQSTVRDDLAQLSGSTQLPERVIGTDGRERPATRTISPTGEGVEPFPLQRSGQGEEEPLQGAVPASPTTTAAEVEASPSADGTESDSDALRQHASARVTDGESVPVPAAPVEGGGVAGATPDGGSRADYGHALTVLGGLLEALPDGPHRDRAGELLADLAREIRAALDDLENEL